LKKTIDLLLENEKCDGKISLPTVANTMKKLSEHPRGCRVVGFILAGYARDEANKKLKGNNHLMLVL